MSHNNYFLWVLALVCLCSTSHAKMQLGFAIADDITVDGIRSGTAFLFSPTDDSREQQDAMDHLHDITLIISFACTLVCTFLFLILLYGYVKNWTYLVSDWCRVYSCALPMAFCVLNTLKLWNGDPFGHIGLAIGLYNAVMVIALYIDIYHYVSYDSSNRVLTQNLEIIISNKTTLDILNENGKIPSDFIVDGVHITSALRRYEIQMGASTVWYLIVVVATVIIQPTRLYRTAAIFLQLTGILSTGICLPMMIRAAEFIESRPMFKQLRLINSFWGFTAVQGFVFSFFVALKSNWWDYADYDIANFWLHIEVTFICCEMVILAICMQWSFSAKIFYTVLRKHCEKVAVLTGEKKKNFPGTYANIDIPNRSKDIESKKGKGVKPSKKPTIQPEQDGAQATGEKKSVTDEEFFI